MGFLTKQKRKKTEIFKKFQRLSCRSSRQICSRFVLSIHFCSFCLYNNKNITLWLEDINFNLCSRGQKICHSFASLTREILFLPLEHKIHLFWLPCFHNLLLAKAQIKTFLKSDNQGIKGLFQRLPAPKRSPGHPFLFHNLSCLNISNQHAKFERKSIVSSTSTESP